MTSPPAKRRRDAARMVEVADNLHRQADVFEVRQLLRMGAEAMVELARMMEEEARRLEAGKGGG